jgi:hypothetical protein
MYQGIVTKYLGATNFRGSRVKATSASGHTITLTWDDSHNSDWNHIEAALALATKLDWRGNWYGGAIPGHDRGYAFVMGEGRASDGPVFKVNGK